MAESYLWECAACCAVYRTASAFNAHIDEYKSREAELEKWQANTRAEIEKCKAHVSANLDNDPDDREIVDYDRNGLSETTGQMFYCPHETCKRTQAFSRRRDLRQHFRTHVECNEVCVHCHQISTLASQCLRHTRHPEDKDLIKAAYMRKRREMIFQLVDQQLDLTECQKRAQSSAGTSGVKRARLGSVDAVFAQPATASVCFESCVKPSIVPDFTNAPVEAFLAHAVDVLLAVAFP